MIVKETLLLQIKSLESFANALGFYVKQNARGHKWYENDCGVKVTVTNMINYHNGSVPGCHCFHGYSDYARHLSHILRSHISEPALKEVYDKRLCYVIKYRYDKKQAKFVGSHFDNLVKLLPGVELI